MAQQERDALRIRLGAELSRKIDDIAELWGVSRQAAAVTLLNQRIAEIDRKIAWHRTDRLIRDANAAAKRLRRSETPNES